MKRGICGLAALLALGLAGQALADDLKADKRFSSTALSFDFQGPYWNATLSVSGPNGYHAATSSEHGPPTLNLQKGGTLPDGLYTYQLTAATNERLEVLNDLDNGRGPNAGKPYKGVSTSGTFLVRNGAIVPQEALLQSE